MKNMLIAFLTLFTFSAFANETNPIKETKSINTEKSNVTWVGKKVTGQHTGTINIKSGKLEFDNGKLSGGSVIIDMGSIACTDLGEGGAQKLEGHLKSDDFFGVANHPTAQFTIDKVTQGKERGALTVNGNITIKGITQPISFDAMMTNSGAKAKLVINRTKFDIKHGSGSFFDNLGDKMIYDDFELDLDLNF